MRSAILVIALAFLLYDWGGQRMSSRAAALWMPGGGEHSLSPPLANTELASAASARVDFDSQIKPILQAKCMPCHFSGGTMYERLPFDRPETIKKLGTKLFTRIQDENHRRLIRDFLAQEP